MTPYIFTGDNSNNIRYVELKGQSHEGITAPVGAKMLDIDNNLADFFSIENSYFECPSANVKEINNQKVQWCKVNLSNEFCAKFMAQIPESKTEAGLALNLF